ncbi:cupin domain-containing protein [Fulvivirga ulvae]|uniref:cupin domain-containing protein n=1 Tax=Fulvivirga ulvae TaxID=2904245 RepID=UPI001F2BFA9B|nr:cupin domain-containing protein [Fulvivirga ulvae]UII29694.1 cupin domain-containing protein [Fulvivirga ulvae]
MKKKALIKLPPDGGRKYDMGSMRAIFKADEEATLAQYSVSEWWLEPHSTGPGAHLHEHNDEIFYVLEGTVSMLVGDEWVEAKKGAFFLIPANTMHDFANNSDQPMGLLNVYIPGGFERDMPAILQWYEDNRKPTKE